MSALPWENGPDLDTATVVNGAATAGGAATIPNNCSTYILKPAGTIATYTLTFPTTEADHQKLRIATSQQVTSLTLTAAGSDTINGAPASLAANTGVAWEYDAATKLWFHL